VDATDLAEWLQTFGQSDSLLAATAAPSESPPAAPFVSSKTSSLAELVDAAMALEWLTPDGNNEEPLLFEDPAVMPRHTAPVNVDVEPILAAAAAVAFDSLALESVDEQPALDAELDDDPLAVQLYDQVM